MKSLFKAVPTQKVEAGVDPKSILCAFFKQNLCKNFLDALENNKYGWFWECPNGGKNCKYRHALPKDYVLKKDRKRMEKEAQAISIEELIEKERANLDTSK